MRILEVREKTVPLEGNIQNAVISFNDHTVSLVALVSDQIKNGKPVIGFAFNSIGRFGQSGIINGRLADRIINSDTLLDQEGHFSPALVAGAAMKNEKPGGHGDRAGAVAAIELAAWDLRAKMNDEPAYATIAKTFQRDISDASTSVYAAGGYYYPGNSTEQLKAELREYLDQGYTSFKIKIGGALLNQDMRRIESALEITGKGSALSVDANGRFDLKQALNYARAIQPLNLRWLEEPGDPLDFQLNQLLIDEYQGPIATGENLFSRIDSLNLIRFGGMRPDIDIFQMDPGLSYGLTEYAAILADLESAGFNRRECWPHGGHLINLHTAIGLELGGCEAYPGVFQPFGGYSDACGIEDGSVTAPSAPGFGLETKPELIHHLKELRGD